MELRGVDPAERERLADVFASLVERAVRIAAAAAVDALRDGPATVEDLAAVSGSFAVSLDDMLAPALRRIFELAAASAADALGELPGDSPLAAAGFVPPPPASELADRYLAAATNRLARIGDAVWTATRAELAAGIAAGESVDELAARVEQAADVPLARARAIARTEAHAAATAGELAQFRATGLPGTKTWVSAHDDRVRPTHAVADGQTVPIGEPFIVGGWPLDRPGDADGPPEETVNCRCWMRFDVDALSAAATQEAPMTAPAVLAAGAPDVSGRGGYDLPADAPDVSGRGVGADGPPVSGTDETTAAAIAAALASVDPAAGRYSFTLALEDAPTLEDPAREFLGGVLTWDATPFPLKWQEAEAPGHEGSVIAGRVDHVWREPGRMRGVLQFDLDGRHGAEAHRLVQGRYLKGGSLLADDITDADVEAIFPQAAAADDDDDGDGGGLLDLFGPKPEKLVFHSGRIRSWTLVAEPAFADALVDVGEIELVAAGEPSAFADVDNSTWDADAAMGACSTAACYRSICAGRKAGPPDERGSWALPHHKTQGGPPNANGVRNALARFSTTQGLTNAAQARAHLERHMSAISASALVAAAATITIPDLPPVEWFDEPFETSRIGGLTVTPEGRVYGLLAPFGVAHRGFDRIIEAPRGTVDYTAWQNKPAFVAADGDVLQIPAGNITMDCGHAPRFRPTPKVGPEHYDNSCSVVARVAIGENDRGVWIAGALLPDVTAEQVQRMLACELSGDWEPHRDRPGWSRFVAAHLVPVGGFPTAQADSATRVRYRAGQLVASAVPVSVGGDPPPTDELARRRRAADLIASSIGRDVETRRRELGRLVHPSTRERG